MTTDYDPNVLQQYADQLYRQAKWIVFWTALRYGLIGLLVIGVAAGLIASLNPANVSPSVISLGPLLGLAVGIFVGVDAGEEKRSISNCRRSNYFASERSSLIPGQRGRT